MTQPDSPDGRSAGDAAPHDPYAAMRLGNFRLYWVGNLLAVFGLQMQAASLNWEIQERTQDTFMVGLVGLVQVIPVLSLILLGGHVADRVDRKKIMSCALALTATASLGLALVSFNEWNVALMFVCLFWVGVARAFHQPAKTAFIPQIVPRAIFSNAVTWSLGAFQLAQMTGLALGGILARTGYEYAVYFFEAMAAISFIVLLLGVRREPSAAAVTHETATLKSLGEGLKYVWSTKLVLGAMALDMFAVLLGGATALLPAYAQNILHSSPLEYGCLVSAQAVGSVATSLVLMHRPPMAKAGRTLLLAVAGFGAAIIVFGLSTSFWISLAALVVTGICDCISVIVRHTLLQLQTPDRMRGRVSAISGMFISASNELGEFESGTVARLTSPVVSVVSGGIGTLVVVAVAASTVPELRKFGRLDSALTSEPDETPEAEFVEEVEQAKL